MDSGGIRPEDEKWFALDREKNQRDAIKELREENEKMKAEIRRLNRMLVD